MDFLGGGVGKELTDDGAIFSEADVAWCRVPLVAFVYRTIIVRGTRFRVTRILVLVSGLRRGQLWLHRRTRLLGDKSRRVRGCFCKGLGWTGRGVIDHGLFLGDLVTGSDTFAKRSESLRAEF